MRSLTGLSARREQILQERLMLQTAARIEVRFRREISGAMRDMAKNYASPGDIAAINADHGRRVEALILTEWKATAELFGGRILDAAGKSCRHGMQHKLIDVPGTPEFNEAMRRWAQAHGAQKVTQIAGTTQEQAMKIINDIIAQAVRDGLGERATAALLTERMSQAAAVLSSSRARTISRTESHNAAGAANHEAAKATGLPMVKEWASSQSERTREAHSMANGQRVGLEEMFIVGGEELQYPGDANGSAENVINCRCAEILLVI